MVWQVINFHWIVLLHWQFVEYSDDEEERAIKREKKKKNRDEKEEADKEDIGEVLPGASAVKKFRNRDQEG